MVQYIVINTRIRYKNISIVSTYLQQITIKNDGNIPKRPAKLKYDKQSKHRPFPESIFLSAKLI